MAVLCFATQGVFLGEWNKYGESLFPSREKALRMYFAGKDRTLEIAVTQCSPLKKGEQDKIMEEMSVTGC